MSSPSRVAVVIGSLASVLLLLPACNTTASMPAKVGFVDTSAAGAGIPMAATVGTAAGMGGSSLQGGGGGTVAMRAPSTAAPTLGTGDHAGATAGTGATGGTGAIGGVRATGGVGATGGAGGSTTATGGTGGLDGTGGVGGSSGDNGTVGSAAAGSRDPNGPCADLELVCFDFIDMWANPECATCNGGQGCQGCAIPFAY